MTSNASGFTISHADHVGFAVSSLDRAEAFWVDVMGATLVSKSQSGGGRECSVSDLLHANPLELVNAGAIARGLTCVTLCNRLFSPTQTSKNPPRLQETQGVAMI